MGWGMGKGATKGKSEGEYGLRRKPDAGLDPSIRDRDLSQRHTLNLLSHPGT